MAQNERRLCEFHTIKTLFVEKTVKFDSFKIIFPSAKIELEIYEKRGAVVSECSL